MAHEPHIRRQEYRLYTVISQEIGTDPDREWGLHQSRFHGM